MAERTAVIIIDALGYEIALKHDFAPSGVPHRTRLRTVLGFSQAALTSILTGSAPDVHGLWMMYSFAGGRGPFGILGPLSLLGGTDRLWVRRVLDWKLSRIDRVTAYYSLYDVPADVMRYLDLPARRSVFGPLGGGLRHTLVDEAEASGRIFVRDHTTPEDRAFDELDAALTRGDTHFNLLYTAGLDSALHRYGTGDGEIRSRLASYGQRIEALAATFPDVRFIVLGDHGMCDVESSIDLKKRVDKADLDIPGDYVPFYDSTMARFSLRSGRAHERVREILARTGKGRILEGDELADLGAAFPGGEFGDLVFLCDPGTIILPSYMGSAPVKGMHGYHPDALCMYSLMLSSSPFGSDEASITGIADFLLPGFQGRGADR